MSNEYPLFPQLPESGGIASQELIEKFKQEMKKISSEIIGEFYCDVAVYVEEDSWTNYRNELMDGLCNYNNRKIQGKYDFKRIRRAILKEHRDEILKDLNSDLIEENEELKKQLEYYQNNNY